MESSAELPGDMIIPEDVGNILKKYEISIYFHMRDYGSPEEIRQTMSKELLDHYKLSANSLDPLDQSRVKYLLTQTKQSYELYHKICQERLANKININDTLTRLKSLVLPEQRSKEWYEMRETVLTASSLADALGKGHFNTKESLLIDKTSKVKKPFIMNEIMEWGVMYESIATMFYEKLYNLNIVEFGLVPHPSFPIFGASPDGICDSDSPPNYIGRMLEIKCPPKRKFTKDVPTHYWMQMQGQLETCDLEECDFFQVKLEEYQNNKEYIQDVLLDQGENIVHGYSNTGHPKGLVLAFKTMIDGQPHYEYEYSPFAQTMSSITKWQDLLMNAHPENTYDKCIEHWYRIERYECTLVLRDREWWLETMPKIIDFWEDVVHYRKEGNQSLIDKKEGRKQKKRINLESKKKSAPSKNIIHVNKSIVDQIQSTCLLDSDDD